MPTRASTPEALQAARQARHKRWRDSLSDRDLARILDLAREATATHTPQRLDDLDAPSIAVGVCMVGQENRTSGERIGTVLQGAVAVLVWEVGAPPRN